MRDILFACWSVVILAGNVNVVADMTAEAGEVAALHTIMANAEGKMVSPTQHNSPLGEKESKYINKVIEGINDYGKKAKSVKLLFFIHGGLNIPSTGILRSACLAETILKDVPPTTGETEFKKKKRTEKLRKDREDCIEGKRAPELVRISTDFEGYYPIFINWRSGLLTSYSEHLVATRQGERWRPAGGWVTSPFLLISDLGRAVFRAPMVWIQGARSGLQSFRGTPPFGEEKVVLQRYNSLKEIEDEEDSIKLSIGLDHGPRGAFGKLDDETEKQQYYNGEDPDGSWTEGALKTTSWFITLPTKAIAAPAIDGMGKPAWDIMNRRTELLRRQPCEFDEVLGECNDLSFRRSGAVAKFLDRLVIELAGDDYSKKEVEITIMGHSMGAIVANWIIADYGAALKPKNIVYMAAASSIRDFETKVIPYLASAEGKETRFFNLTLHPRAEVRERNGDFGVKILDFAPRGSLLVWIDNYLANPETFLDRTLGRWDNIIVSTQIFPKQIRKNINIKAFGICKWGEQRPEDNPEKHGEFSEGEFWRLEYWDTKAPVEKCNREQSS